MPSIDPKKTVLVVDDNTMLLDSVAAMLQMLGWEVTKSATGTDGLQAIEQANGELDLVILDLLMPDLNGFEVLRRMKEYTDTPVILASGCGEVREDGPVRPDAWLNKPFRLEELQEAIAKAMDRR